MAARLRLRKRKYSPWESVAAGRCAFTIGVEAANVINVAGQFKLDSSGNVARRVSCRIYLSDDANGDSVVAAAPSGGWAIGTNGLLIDLNTTTAKMAQLVSKVDGSFDINITEAGVKTVYLIIIMPDGSLIASPAITWA